MTIFYDTGCGDMVCKYSTVQRLSREAQQECKCPIELGGVGNILTKSFPGIYQINLLLISQAEAILSGVCPENIT